LFQWIHILHILSKMYWNLSLILTWMDTMWQVAYCLVQGFVVRIFGFYKLMCLYIFIYLFYIICSVHLFRSFVKNWKVFYKC
jgi:hypothetical protein